MVRAIGGMVGGDGNGSTVQVDLEKVKTTLAKTVRHQQVKNLVKYNQNFQIPGKDGTLTELIQSFTIGKEFSYGRYVTAGTLNGAVFKDGLFDAASGSYYVECEGEYPDAFYGVVVNDQLIKTGCSISLVNGYTRLTVDMALAPAHEFPQVSLVDGAAPKLNDIDSMTYGNNRSNYLLVRGTKNKGIQGGSAIAGLSVRELDTVFINTIKGASLENNTLKLPKGRYFVKASAPGYSVDRHRIYLRVAGDNTKILALGTSEYSDYAQTRSVLKTEFTLLEETQVQLCHSSYSAESGNGFGIETSRLDMREYYAELELEKLI